MKRRLKIIVPLIIVLSLAAFIGSGVVIRNAAKGRTFSDAATIPYRKVGVVLGCSQRLSGGRANLFFINRIAAAAQLFAAHKVDYLIVSGDNHVAGYDEPTDMKRALVQAGVPAERVYCDFAGRRTFDSVVRAKAVFGQTSITVISQEFHNQRAIYIAGNQGMDAIGFNARAVDSYSSFRTMLREQFARVRTVMDVCLLGTHPKFLGPRIDIGDAGRQGHQAGAETNLLKGPVSRITTSPPASPAPAAKAIALAHQCLVTESLDWGTPVKVMWQNDYRRHLVLYPTPEREKVMVGDRGVFVEENGRAWVMQRM